MEVYMHENSEWVSIAKYVALPYCTEISLVIQSGYTEKEKKGLWSSNWSRHYNLNKSDYALFQIIMIVI